MMLLSSQKNFKVQYQVGKDGEKTVQFCVNAGSAFEALYKAEMLFKVAFGYTPNKEMKQHVSHQE
jgi:hypothetical protein